MKVQGGIVVILTPASVLALALALVSYFKDFTTESFLCDGQDVIKASYSVCRQVLLSLPTVAPNLSYRKNSKYWDIYV